MAGTVISGGFPGRVAQEVQPNPKCNGCLHFDGQGGRTGICSIGTRPWLCGEGEAQEIGYAPIARGAGSYLPDMSNHGAHAPEVAPQDVSTPLHGAGSHRPVSFQQVSLGEEHVHVVKSMVEQHASLQKSMCRLCSQRGAHGISPPNVGPQLCTCSPLEAAMVAKAIVSKMSNAMRQVYTLDDVVEWVRDVAKAGFRLPVPKKARSLGKRVEAADRHGEHKAKPGRLSDQVQVSDRSGGHLQRVRKSDAVVKAEAPHHHLQWHAGGTSEHVDASAHHGSYTVQPTTKGHSVLYIPTNKKSPIQHLGYHESKHAAIKTIDAHHAGVSKKSLSNDVEKAEAEHGFKSGHLQRVRKSDGAPSSPGSAITRHRSQWRVTGPDGVHMHFKTRSAAKEHVRAGVAHYGAVREISDPGEAEKYHAQALAHYQHTRGIKG